MMGVKTTIRWHESGYIFVFIADGWIRGFVWWEADMWRAVCNLGIGGIVELEGTNKRKLQRAVEREWKRMKICGHTAFEHCECTDQEAK